MSGLVPPAHFLQQPVGILDALVEFAHAHPLIASVRAVAGEPTDAAAADRLSRNVYFNAQLRTTCVATLISGGHAENALPQRARATIQCRMMPGDMTRRHDTM